MGHGNGVFVKNKLPVLVSLKPDRTLNVEIFCVWSQNIKKRNAT